MCIEIKISKTLKKLSPSFNTFYCESNILIGFDIRGSAFIYIKRIINCLNYSRGTTEEVLRLSYFYLTLRI